MEAETSKKFVQKPLIDENR
ncbi:unnamed protein product [Chironomus riparius]|uniref:Uncharacterized protein n=1 Tax=Chironomus riparius TaxID=315576 RepID=A0A9N9S8Q4_9DIPT|nr:unnamed protein product [Chironomus riparius]